MSNQTIAIVDYAMGNIRSVQQALAYVSPNDTVLVTHDKEALLSADRIVFPGQGAMAACMEALQKHQLIPTIKQCAAQKPFLGICLGLQLLFDGSQENNGTRGLGIVPGKVLKFSSDNHLKIPHIGWNTVAQVQDHSLWHGIDNHARFYSVHGYFVKPKQDQCVVGVTDYGTQFASAIANDYIFAVQFHPEKSQHNGLTLLKNFTNW